jgi:hypothetical protein
MKKLLSAGIAIVLSIFISSFSRQQSSVAGAWSWQADGIDQVLIFKDGYFSFSRFDVANKKFIRTFGGTYSEGGGQLHANIEFDTEQPASVGRHFHYAYSVSEKQLKTNIGGGMNDWVRVDEGTGNLAGNWRISGRMNDGQMQEVKPGPRKTLKILSATRFQWMAINTGTKEFFGTGGGTYTFQDGKYTEHIEFFSRDSSRVGASLTFDASVNNNVWTHKGLSSKGDPIHEEWTREN